MVDLSGISANNLDEMIQFRHGINSISGFGDLPIGSDRFQSLDRMQTRRLLEALEALESDSDWLQQEIDELSRKLRIRLDEADRLVHPDHAPSPPAREKKKRKRNGRRRLSD